MGQTAYLFSATALTRSRELRPLVLFGDSVAKRAKETGTPCSSHGKRTIALARALGAGVTACYIYGLLARREKKVLGLGPDSLVVPFTYIGGVLLLTFVAG